MEAAGTDWSLMAIIGVVIFAAVIAWAALRNRKEGPPKSTTEEATRRVYEEEDRAHRGESDNVP